MSNLNYIQRNLRCKFLCMKLWAERYNINNFPEKLKSLQNQNPCYQEIQKEVEKVIN